MIRLVCKECGTEWFTANTKSDMKCDVCGGELKEDVYADDNKDLR